MKNELTSKDETMPVTPAPGATKNDADPAEEAKTNVNDQITLQSQKGKVNDADPSAGEGKPTKE